MLFARRLPIQQDYACYECALRQMHAPGFYPLHKTAYPNRDVYPTFPAKHTWLDPRPRIDFNDFHWTDPVI